MTRSTYKSKIAMSLASLVIMFTVTVFLNLRTYHLLQRNQALFTPYADASQLPIIFERICLDIEMSLHTAEKNKSEQDLQKNTLFLEIFDRLLTSSTPEERLQVNHIRHRYIEFEKLALRYQSTRTSLPENQAPPGNKYSEFKGSSTLTSLKKKLKTDLDRLAQKHYRSMLGSVKKTALEARKLYFLSLVVGATGMVILLAVFFFMIKQKAVSYQESLLTRSSRQTVLSDESEAQAAERMSSANLSDEKRQTVREKSFTDHYFGHLMQSLPDILIITDPEGTINMINHHGLKLLDYEANEIQGQFIAQFFRENQETIDSFFKEKNGQLHELQSIETTVRTKKGEAIPVLFSARELNIEGDHTEPGFVCLIHDFTAHKEREHVLYEAKLKAEQANREKSIFLAKMSHELRTPLNAIIGYSEMLQEEALEEGRTGTVADLKKIHRSGKLLLQLINDILNLSRIEVGKLKLSPDTFDVYLFIQDIADTVQPMMNQNHNVLEVLCPKDIGPMYSDRVKLQQAIHNLLSNAAKFTNKGRITLDVSKYDTNLSEYIKVNVSDTGIGIRKEKLEKLFKEFSQVVSTTTLRSEGTGLGLAITKKMCQMLGGDISVVSERGQGSTFTIEIPTKVTSETEENNSAEQFS
ncbi:PAS domain-containing sensor histidine kinase [candidate division CSSED10-310 bacterium]|uniref:histidine kinase n=1 Tax=candidate division CSSED10-310 bacterium TaxID=2855610 RepID=A0ABV6Z3Y3_UNCC1